MPRDCGRKKETERPRNFNYGCQNDLGPVGISTGVEQLQKCVIHKVQVVSIRQPDLFVVTRSRHNVLGGHNYLSVNKGSERGGV